MEALACRVRKFGLYSVIEHEKAEERKARQQVARKEVTLTI